MGFLVNFNRKMYLTNYINFLESKITERTQVKLEMADQIAQYTSEINDFADKDSPAVKKLEAKKAELEAMEKKIDAEIQKFQTQLQAANTEIQSADNALQSSLQRSFSYSFGGR